MRRRTAIVGFVLMVGLTPALLRAEGQPGRSAGASAYYTGVAVAANVVPVLPALYAPRCLVGYVLCKTLFAGLSVIAAADQIIMSGGGDFEQTRGILYRGFSGDWYLTSRHTSREVAPEVLPDPPPPAAKPGWTPPPI
jgi:hypothetical protein